MTQKNGDSAGLFTPTQVVAARVKQLRKEQGLSAQKLADRCAEAGGRDLATRSVIANLESGRRDTVSIDEVFVLAFALNVAPVHLVIPTDAVPVRVPPAQVVDSARARD